MTATRVTPGATSLNNCAHFSQVPRHRPPRPREALADLLRHAVRVVQLADVDRAVCRVLRLESGALQSKQRLWAISQPRMLAIYLLGLDTDFDVTEPPELIDALNKIAHRARR